MDSSNQQKSEFNDAIGFLNRCNQLFYLIDSFSASLDVYNWHQHLKILFKELSPDINNENKKKIRDMLRSLVYQVNKTVTNPNKKIDSDIIEKLDDIEIELREIYDKCGYRSKIQSDATKSLK